MKRWSWAWWRHQLGWYDNSKFNNKIQITSKAIGSRWRFGADGWPLHDYCKFSLDPQWIEQLASDKLDAFGDRRVGLANWVKSLPKTPDREECWPICEEDLIDFIARREGRDCEDHAILYYTAAQALGLSGVRLAVGHHGSNPTSRKINHAVCLVENSEDLSDPIVIECTFPFPISGLYDTESKVTKYHTLLSYGDDEYRLHGPFMR